jgi:hypothetical protein
MKRIALLSLILVAGVGVSCSCLRGGGTAQSIDLFNGRDLTGWKSTLADPAVKAESVWSVQEGILICKGEPLGYLFTDKTFTNFRLLVEYRCAPGQTPGNSGLFARINGPPRPLPRCIETQLKHGDAGDLLGLQGLKIGGAGPRFQTILNHELAGDICVVKRMSGNEKPAGEWNRVLILAQGDHMTVWLNGIQVNEATQAEVIAGPVGLQSEGGEIHFRTVRITPLD